MYIVTGLGQIFKPRPKVTPKLPPKALPKAPPRIGYVAKNGHRRFCGAADDGVVSCKARLPAPLVAIAASDESVRSSAKSMALGRGHGCSLR